MCSISYIIALCSSIDHSKQTWYIPHVYIHSFYALTTTALTIYLNFKGEDYIIPVTTRIFFINKKMWFGFFIHLTHYLLNFRLCYRCYNRKQHWLGVWCTWSQILVWVEFEGCRRHLSVHPACRSDCAYRKRDKWRLLRRHHRYEVVDDVIFVVRLFYKIWRNSSLHLNERR